MFSGGGRKQVHRSFAAKHAAQDDKEVQVGQLQEGQSVIKVLIQAHDSASRNVRLRK